MKTTPWLLCALILLPFQYGFTQGSGTSIEILDVGDSGVVSDGTVFRAEPEPTEPATGTGVFQPFVRTQAGGNSPNIGQHQSGYNTDVGPPLTNFDTKGGSHWTRSIRLGEVGRIVIDGILYYQFQLDANEQGGATSNANQIDIVDVQIYVGSAPLLATPELGTGYTGTPYDASDNSLLGMAPVWSLDNAVNGDVTVTLQASICNTPGQCGSGHGDMEMLIPVSEFGGEPTDFLVFYVEYDRAGSPNGGFEEWRTPLQPITAKIGNRVFSDADCDGIQDENELSMAGVEVQLLDAVTNTVLGTTTTDADGEYEFCVQPGIYQVCVQFDSMIFFAAPQGAGVDPELDSDIGSDGKSQSLVVADGEDRGDIDAGLCLNCPSGVAFIDTNLPACNDPLDPVLTADDPVLGTNWTVRLTSQFPTTIFPQANFRLFVSFGPPAAQLIPGSTCFLYLDPMAFTVVATGPLFPDGSFSATLPLPADPSMSGVEVTLQARVCEPTVPGPIPGFPDFFSNGMHIIFGCP